ncbi:hypothetical protein GAO09_12020 [Rhizobiales bacterium RZME27]|uniref:Uncharacterized protein n=1 Tax=Endobacterium cereale TaxID=2663029 RepID=A0A6A8AA43_9HYPH|nr:hypothetical protein [Endobacterium cereale]MEB2847907.1 hypothetical protein [Endobacterium cereale]MQY46757.1 hypothetical protein [Endobacterium cereale]
MGPFPRGIGFSDAWEQRAFNARPSIWTVAIANAHIPQNSWELIATHGIMSTERKNSFEVGVMRKVAVTVMAGTRTLAEDFVPALALFAAVFSAGIYAKGFLNVSYAAGSF